MYFLHLPSIVLHHTCIFLSVFHLFTSNETICTVCCGVSCWPLGVSIGPLLNPLFLVCLFLSSCESHQQPAAGVGQTEVQRGQSIRTPLAAGQTPAGLYWEMDLNPQITAKILDCHFCEHMTCFLSNFTAYFDCLMYFSEGITSYVT